MQSVSNSTPNKTIYFLQKLPHEYTLFKIEKNLADNALRTILSLLLSDAIYTIVSNTKEISILKQQNSDINIEGSYTDPEDYYCLELTTSNPMLSETGLLAKISNFFADNDIPILCVSSYSTNHIYYPKCKHDELLLAISNHFDDRYQLLYEDEV